MKNLLKQLSLVGLTACGFCLAAIQGNSQTVQVGIDPAKTWLGYMNVFNLPSEGGAYQWGSAWGTADLRASFSGSTLTLAPNINCYNAADPYWTKPDGSPNKNMIASMYVQDDTLGGQTVSFSGYVLNNTLVSPYTSVAFIKDFRPDYSYFTQITVPLVSGQFSISLATAAGDHIQYGFDTTGPDANPALASSLGFVQLSPVPEPASLALLGMGLLGMLIWRRGQ